MTPTQCKMARAATGLNIIKLANACEISPNTVFRFESGQPVYDSTVIKIKAALEATGLIRFDGDNCVCINDSETAAQIQINYASNQEES